MANETNYEVQVQQGAAGRWSIHARYPWNKKDAAIEDGKHLEKMPGVTAVKVVKEVYDAEKGSSAEFIVFKSAGMKAGMAAPPPPAKGGAKPPRIEPKRVAVEAPRPAPTFDAPEAHVKKRPAKKGKTTSMVSVVVRILCVVLFSIALAAAAMGMASIWLHDVSIFGTRMVGNAKENALFGIFVGTFLLSALITGPALLGGVKLSPVQRAPRPIVPKAASAPAPVRVRHAPAPSAQDLRNAAAELRAADGETPAEEKPAEAEEKKEEDDGVEKKGVVLDAESTPAPESPEDSNIVKQRNYILKFIGDALRGAQADPRTMDNFNKFGLNLFLAGAGEVLAQNRSLTQPERVAILTGVVQGLGFKKSHAQSFSERYEEYLLQDSRYMQMYQTGRNAMNTYFTDNGHIGRNLQAAMSEWNKPKPKEESSGLITVLFTDIAGSTAMTQRLGDAGAQQVVRAHNRIVREALSTCSGREIKHTGDGIMASFSKVTDGLDAAIQIQRGCYSHTVATPSLPLTLKIGINAGEPIAEDNDLFGTTVQMTARICDKAKGQEVLVSEIVKGICAGKTYNFINRGGFAMKGFDGDQTLYEVQWRDSSMPAQAAPAQAAPQPQPAQAAQPRPMAAAARPVAGAARPAASNVRPIGAARPPAGTGARPVQAARPVASAQPKPR